MKQGIIISAILHLLVISAVLFAAPFSIKKKPFDYDVIKINAVSAPQSFTDVPATIEDIVIPEAIPDDESFDIPIDDPTSIDKPVKIDKPKPAKQKPKKDKKKKNRKPKGKTQTKPTKNKTESGKEIDTKTTGKGSPFAGASVDNESFDYPYWFTQAFNKISRNFRRTISLDGNVICVVYFEVIRSGRVVKLEIKQSSGIPGVDRDCLAAIERSKPFPPLPPEFRDEIIGITIPINY